MRQLSQWRTVGVAVFACVLLFVAYLLTTAWASPKGAPLALVDVARLYEHLTDAVVWLIAAVALKSGVEHIGKGKGLKGARDVLLTDAQPGDAPTCEPKP